MALIWNQIGAITVNLSIKNVPDAVVENLRARAARNHRSLQGELLAIVEAAVRDEPQESLDDVLAEIRSLNLRSQNESAEIVRALRDGRSGY